jgi:hypothetical protein
MARAISSDLLTAMGQSTIQPYYAVEFMFDSGTLRLWTGYGDKDITVRGVTQTFTGSGTMLNISGISEVNDLSSKPITLSLSGITSDALLYALSEQYQRRDCRIYFGELSTPDVVEIFTGKMDTMTLEDSGETSNIILTVESNLVELERSSNWRYTHESYKSRYPNDTFFSFVQGIQDQQIAWGRKAT